MDYADNSNDDNAAHPTEETTNIIVVYYGYPWRNTLMALIVIKIILLAIYIYIRCTRRMSNARSVVTVDPGINVTRMSNPYPYNLHTPAMNMNLPDENEQNDKRKLFHNV